MVKGKVKVMLRPERIFELRFEDKFVGLRTAVECSGRKDFCVNGRSKLL